MKFAQFALLIVALIAVIASTAEAKATQVVRWNKKMSGKSTWFNGHDLKAVACYGDLENNSHVNAGDGWHIGAVHMNFYVKGEKAACFECAKISANGRSVIVRIIDDCAGCAPNQIDLTASAFKVLAPLSQGVVKTTYEFVRCPSSNLKWPKSPSIKKN
ncbi:hypothetical protein CPC16_005502 [Podila verticillata]|nr:hypothetical protein BGZ52_006670 [Haplosporangium bisporale]KAF9389881.1 hypothetical protein CPC16_005502 [Podila verticillata]KAI9233282.1 MAG: RlpA-like double-psi beta-barrel-protein domain-containing protein-containing protein [Podila humilis]